MVPGSRLEDPRGTGIFQHASATSGPDAGCGEAASGATAPLAQLWEKQGEELVKQNIYYVSCFFFSLPPYSEFGTDNLGG